MELKYEPVGNNCKTEFCGFDTEDGFCELSEVYKRLDNDKLYVFLEDGCGCTCMHEIKEVLR